MAVNTAFRFEIALVHLGNMYKVQAMSVIYCYSCSGGIKTATTLVAGIILTFFFQKWIAHTSITIMQGGPSDKLGIPFSRPSTELDIADGIYDCTGQACTPFYLLYQYHCSK